MNGMFWTVVIGLVFLAIIMVVDAIVRYALLRWRIRRVKQKREDRKGGHHDQIQRSHSMPPLRRTYPILPELHDGEKEPGERIPGQI